MKKKILATVAALACAVGVTSALAACGGDGEKSHTEAQWKAAFNSVLDAQSYMLSYQAYDETDGLYKSVMNMQYDGVNHNYMRQTADGEMSALVVKDGKYYAIGKYDGQYIGEELTKAEFDEQEEEQTSAYGTMAEGWLKYLRDQYAKFPLDGKGNHSNGTVSIDYKSYMWKGATYSEKIEGKDYTYNIERIYVQINSADNSLYAVEVEGITGGDLPGKTQYVFYGGNNIQKTLSEEYNVIYGQAGGKGHNETQWKAAFDAVMDSEQYTMKINAHNEEGEYYYPYLTLEFDGVNQQYTQNDSTINNSFQALTKRDGRYYSIGFINGGYYAIQLTPAQFNNFVEAHTAEYGAIAAGWMTHLSNHYADFTEDGTGASMLDPDDYYDYHIYKWENATYNETVGDITSSYAIESVVVKIRDDNNALIDVVATGVTKAGEEGMMEFTFSGEIDIQGSLQYKYVVYPDVLGQSFYLTEVSPADGFDTSLIGTIIDCSATGELSGDIEMFGKPISDFTIKDEYGVITMTDKDNEITLTGEIIHQYGIRLVLTLNVNTGDGDVQYKFTLERKNSQD